MNVQPEHLSIDELAELGGVSRRTVRYYIQEGLLPKPLGVGRGRHYDRSHLERLLQVKAQQEAGLSLDAIRSAPRQSFGSGLVAPPDRPVSGNVWRRFELMPGVELHVAQDSPLVAAGRLTEVLKSVTDQLRTYESLDQEGERIA
jgi:DNA-binding transcriptional MerR regulator